jgi:hypothetical protein
MCLSDGYGWFLPEPDRELPEELDGCDLGGGGDEYAGLGAGAGADLAGGAETDGRFADGGGE